MTANEALEEMCRRCRSFINQIPSTGDRMYKECPWRGISGDLCPEYEKIKEKLLK